LKDEWAHCIELVKREVVPSVGCTEPVAVALIAARAAEILGCEPEYMELEVSGNLLKNGMGVIVPGTGMAGLSIAAAVGALGGKSSYELEVLREITPASIERAKAMVRDNRIHIRISQKEILLYASIKAYVGSDCAEVELIDTHSNIIKATLNGVVLFAANAIEDQTRNDTQWPLRIDSIVDFSLHTDFNDISFILESARINEIVAEEGLRRCYGLGIGRTIDSSIQKRLMGDDCMTFAMKLAAAASDARMAGVMMPVMSNSGSGNQGITCTMPIVAYARRLRIGKDRLARALVLSHLISIHIKHYLGRLSALCGVTVAACAASCGIVILMNYGIKEIEMTIRNMIGTIAGVICDGAKVGCAMKVATSVNAGIQSAILAMEGVSVDGCSGIVDNDIEASIRNLGKLGSEGMHETDKLILDIMVSKHRDLLLDAHINTLIS
jgi:L-cysteine desulfidase